MCLKAVGEVNILHVLPHVASVPGGLATEHTAVHCHPVHLEMNLRHKRRERQVDRPKGITDTKTKTENKRAKQIEKERCIYRERKRQADPREVHVRRTEIKKRY